MKHFELHTLHPGHFFSDKRRFRPFFGNTIQFLLRFDESVIYRTRNESDQWDYMKAAGFREATLKDNSARLGFRWCNSGLEFAPYVHYQGVNMGAKNPVLIYACGITEEINCTIHAEGDHYHFIVNKHTATVPRGGGNILKFTSWPYAEIDFAEGTQHPIKIKLKIL